jgi:DDE superfamily endonuclease
LRCDQLTAPCVFDGPINGAKFLAYVEQVLVPTLSSGEIVMMDNLGSHKRAGVWKAIEAAGAAVSVLPAYKSGPRSHRTSLCQAQTHIAQNGAPDRRCALGGDRNCSRRLSSRKMFQLFSLCRMRVYLTGIRSSAAKGSRQVPNGKAISDNAEPKPRTDCPR